MGKSQGRRSALRRGNEQQQPQSGIQPVTDESESQSPSAPKPEAANWAARATGRASDRVGYGGHANKRKGPDDNPGRRNERR